MVIKQIFINKTVYYLGGILNWPSNSFPHETYCLQLAILPQCWNIPLSGRTKKDAKRFWYFGEMDYTVWVHLNLFKNYEAFMNFVVKENLGTHIMNFWWQFAIPKTENSSGIGQKL